jgi:hypothetical protein
MINFSFLIVNNILLLLLGLIISRVTRFPFLERSLAWFLAIVSGILKLLKKKWLMSLFIFIYNFSAILLYMLSGILFIPPFILPLIMGLSLGSVAFRRLPEDTLSGFRVSENKIMNLAAVFVPIIELSIFIWAAALGEKMAFDIYFFKEGISETILSYTVQYAKFAPIPLLISAFLEMGSIDFKEEPKK